MNKDTKIFFSFSKFPGNSGAKFHNLGYKLKNFNAVYLPQQADNIKNIILLRNKIKNFQGFSLSMPFKKKIIKYLDYKDSSVIESENCNTVLITKNKLKGFNTDYLGIKKIFKKYSLHKFNSILILGNGGVATSFYKVASYFNFKEILLSARNKKKYDTWNIDKGNTRIINWLDRGSLKSQLIINATPIGMKEVKDKEVIFYKDRKNFDIYFDAVIDGKNNSFSKYFIKKNKYISGLEFSLFQAIEQFKIYTGKKLNFNIMKKKLGYKI